MPDVNTLARVLLSAALRLGNDARLQLQILRQPAKLVADLDPETPVPQHFLQCPREFQLARQSASTYFPAFRA